MKLSPSFISHHISSQTGCALPGFPGVYAKVAAQWIWIQKTICNDHSDPKPDFCAAESCTDVPNWIDVDNDGCDWYVERDAPGCPNLGGLYEGLFFGTAREACCYCGGGNRSSA